MVKKAVPVPRQRACFTVTSNVVAYITFGDLGFFSLLAVGVKFLMFRLLRIFRLPRNRNLRTICRGAH